MNQLKFSIIATVKNEQGVISDFITSLLNQSFSPDEIIIVDGNSTDGTNEILKKYRDNGLITLITQDCNIAQGRNIAIKKARNSYIASTDAGCVVDSKWLEELSSAFNQAESPDVVAGNFKFVCHNTFEEAVILATNNPDRENSDEAIFFPSSRSIAFKKSAWEKVKGYPEWLYAAEDTLFNIRLRQLGFKFVFAKKAIVKWRPRETYYAVIKQHFNYARGNGRVGIGTSGYLLNIKYHSLILFFLFLSFVWPAAIIVCGYFVYVHIKHFLWPQAKKTSSQSSSPNMLYKILLIMELMRLAGMSGFIQGKLDRLLNKYFINSQVEWMGIKSLDTQQEDNRA
ncbi:MAG: glycosyltransferase [Methyloprofundus sp.]|nr:glycosyltransferase [Methyloprofundus sp.]